MAAVGSLALAMAACTGRGGGQLPPQSPAFSGPASFGFSFSCEDKSALAGPTGRLHIQLSYMDHGTNPLGRSFSIHGIVDRIDPVLESQFCIGQTEQPGRNELIFLGRYRLTSSAPAGFPSACPTRETTTTSLCRFEVKVRDNDVDRAPSTGDYFHITLSNATELSTQFASTAVVYTRGGVLSDGNLTVE